MKAIRVKLENGEVLAGHASMAESWRERGIGWLAKASAGSGEALLLSPAASIHTFGMRFPIDVVFLDAEFRVRKLCAQVPAGRVCWATFSGLFYSGAWKALEVPAGAAAGLKLGQRLLIEGEGA